MDNRVKIKMCGMTRPEDVKKAVELGVDYLGFIFAVSPRSVSKEKAKELLSGVPDGVKTVGAFANPTEDDIVKVLEAVPFDFVQIHGTLPVLKKIDGARVIRAIRIKTGQNILPSDIPSEYFGVLFDTYAENAMGGTGRNFDWKILRGIAEKVNFRVILAGGLTPENVSEAVGMIKPYMVDVASGIEVSPGIKDHDKMTRFANNVKGTRV